MSAVQSNPLIQVMPTEKLDFRLSLSEPAFTNVLLTNTSSAPVAYKIKTTQPKWYFVSPNQDVIPSGGTFKVQVQLEDEKKNSLVKARMSGSKDKDSSKDKADVERQRFQVQAKEISAEEYRAYLEMETRFREASRNEPEADEEAQAALLEIATERASKFSEIWKDFPKNDPTSLRLKVEYIYDLSTTPVHGTSRTDKINRDMESYRDKFGSGMGSTPGQGQSNKAAGVVDPNAPPATMSANVDKTRQDLARYLTANGGNASLGGGSEQAQSLPDSADSARRALVEIQKKYQKTIDHIAQLTGQRDSFTAKFEQLQREIDRETAKNKDAAGVGAAGGAEEKDPVAGDADAAGQQQASVEAAQQRQASGGFLGNMSIFTLVFVAVVALLLGKYSASNHLFHMIFGFNPHIQ